MKRDGNHQGGDSIALKKGPRKGPKNGQKAHLLRTYYELLEQGGTTVRNFKKGTEKRSEKGTPKGTKN